MWNPIRKWSDMYRSIRMSHITRRKIHDRKEQEVINMMTLPDKDFKTTIIVTNIFKYLKEKMSIIIRMKDIFKLPK